MNKPPSLSPYEEAAVRAWSMDYAIRTNRNNPQLSVQQIIEDAKEIQQYLTGSEPAPVLQIVSKGKNGRK